MHERQPLIHIGVLSGSLISVRFTTFPTPKRPERPINLLRVFKNYKSWYSEKCQRELRRTTGSGAYKRGVCQHFCSVTFAASLNKLTGPITGAGTKSTQTSKQDKREAPSFWHNKTNSLLYEEENHHSDGLNLLC